MTGDQEDFIRRIRSALPIGWFGDQSPILYSVLSGFSDPWSWLYNWINYVIAQTRLKSAVDIWLDLGAADYFGSNLVRRTNQSDDSFKIEVLRNLLCERATRQSVISILECFTKRTPLVFEPARCADTGCYGITPASVGGLGYNLCGGWGSLLLPYQLFVTAYRPVLIGIVFVAGWGCPSGAYGAGAIEYADLTSMEDQVPDSQIYQAVSDVLPVSVIAWVRICN